MINYSGEAVYWLDEMMKKISERTQYVAVDLAFSKNQKVISKDDIHKALFETLKHYEKLNKRGYFNA